MAMEALDKEALPQNWRAPLIKVVSTHVWQTCDRVDMTDPQNWPSPDGSGKSPAYGAYAGGERPGGRAGPCELRARPTAEVVDAWSLG